MEVKERIAYVRGLIEGSDSFDRDATTKSVWENLLRVCDELADSVDSLESAQDEVEQYLEAIDVDLCDLEDEVYGEIVYEDEDEAYEEDDEDAGVEEDEPVEMDEDEAYVRAECPRCGEEVYFEEGFLYDEQVEISCPNCGEVLYRGGGPTYDPRRGDPEDDDGEYDGSPAIHNETGEPRTTP